MSTERGEISLLLDAWRDGDTTAEAKLIERVYPALRRMAGRRMAGERPGHSLEPTALVHEAYLRLVDQRDKTWQNRSHFLAVSAAVMRRVLVDHARKHVAQKRGGGTIHVPFDESTVASDGGTEILVLDRALERLEEHDARAARIVVLKFFGGLSQDEIASMLDISPRTVKRDWTYAKSWLFEQMKKTDADPA